MFKKVREFVGCTLGIFGAMSMCLGGILYTTKLVIAILDSGSSYLTFGGIVLVGFGTLFLGFMIAPSGFESGGRR